MTELTHEELIDRLNELDALSERLDELEYTLEGMREDAKYHLDMRSSYLDDAMVCMFKEEIAQFDILLAIVRGEE